MRKSGEKDDRQRCLQCNVKNGDEGEKAEHANEDEERGDDGREREMHISEVLRMGNVR